MKHILEFEAGFDLIEHPTDAEFSEAIDWLGFGNHNVGDAFNMALDQLDLCDDLLGISLDDLASTICPDMPHFGNIIVRRVAASFGGFLPILCGGQIRIVKLAPKAPEKTLEDSMWDGSMPDQMRKAMHVLGHRIGLKRPLRSAELGRALGLSGKNAGKSVDRWIRGETRPQKTKLHKINRLLAGGSPACGSWSDAVSKSNAYMIK